MNSMARTKWALAERKRKRRKEKKVRGVFVCVWLDLHEPYIFFPFFLP